MGQCLTRNGQDAAEDRQGRIDLDVQPSLRCQASERGAVSLEAVEGRCAVHLLDVPCRIVPSGFLQSRDEGVRAGPAKDAAPPGPFILSDREHGRRDAPAGRAALGEELHVGEPLQVQSQLLIKGQPGSVASFVLILFSRSLHGRIVREVERFDRPPELVPSPLLAGRQPEQQLVGFHREALQIRFAKSRHARHALPASSPAGSTAKPLREQSRITEYHWRTSLPEGT